MLEGISLCETNIFFLLHFNIKTKIFHSILVRFPAQLSYLIVSQTKREISLNKLNSTDKFLFKYISFTRQKSIVVLGIETTSDFPFGFGLFLFNRINTKRFVPPTDLIGLKKLILHIFSNQVAAFLAFYPFYFCIFWENIFSIYKKKVCLLRRSGISHAVCEFFFSYALLEYNMLLYTSYNTQKIDEEFSYYFAWHHRQYIAMEYIELWYQMKAYFSKLNVFSI